MHYACRVRAVRVPCSAAHPNPNPHQVVEKLDSVPVFTVTTLEKQLMPVPDEGGTTCCRWYADVDEAQSTHRP